MKKSICLLLAACLLLSLAACGGGTAETTAAPSAAQTMSTVFRRNGQELKVSVEISGWSASLDGYALTFYDASDKSEPIASCRVLDRTEYNRLMAENSGNATLLKTNNGVRYNEGVGGSSRYIFTVGSGVYCMLSARFGEGAEAIYDRFRVTANEDAAPSDGVDYLVLVNKLHPLPEGWADALGTVRLTNAHGDDVELEANACVAYLRLRETLAAEGITIELDHALRGGEDEPDGSENGTGLALDLYLRDGKTDVYPVYDTGELDETWEAIHAKLADYGFILRYPKLKEHITGFPYDAGHIRYIGDAAAAGQIMDAGITLEEYLGAASSEEVEIDLGESAVFGPMKRHFAANLIKCEFASFADCTLHSLRYTGDGSNTPENVAWLSELAGEKFISVAKYETDFRAGANAEAPLKPGTEYKAYPWWLARRTEGGELYLVCWGEDAPPAETVEETAAG